MVYAKNGGEEQEKQTQTTNAVRRPKTTNNSRREEKESRRTLLPNYALQNREKRKYRDSEQGASWFLASQACKTARLD